MRMLNLDERCKAEWAYPMTAAIGAVLIAPCVCLKSALYLSMPRAVLLCSAALSHAAGRKCRSHACALSVQTPAQSCLKKLACELGLASCCCKLDSVTVLKRAALQGICSYDKANAGRPMCGPCWKPAAGWSRLLLHSHPTVIHFANNQSCTPHDEK